MSNLIHCPSCNHEIAVDQVVQSQLAGQIRRDIELQMADKRKEISVAEDSLKSQRQSLERQKAGFAAELQSAVEIERKKIAAEAELRAKERMTLELQDAASQVVELRSKLKESQANELSLRKHERELQAKAEELQLQAARQIKQERDKIREDAFKQFSESRELKDAEQEKLILDMRRQINELKHKAEQGSVQAQGEVQETALESMLENSFLSDTIEPVPKGVSGADCKQVVRCPSGSSCGSILWESKRTKVFKKEWLPKLRDDQRTARASIAVLVTQTLPQGVDTFTLIDGVWICSWHCAKGLAMALRSGLLEVGKASLASEGRMEKMGLVYNYLAGQDFVRYVNGIVESFIEMESDLAKDKRAAKTSWNRREKQIERMMTNTASLYGDLQGIIGASMPVVDGLCLPRIEDRNSSQVDAA